VSEVAGAHDAAPTRCLTYSSASAAAVTSRMAIMVRLPWLRLDELEYRLTDMLCQRLTDNYFRAGNKKPAEAGCARVTAAR
jgi:hypothetical protein